jgi:hypothetical protein
MRAIREERAPAPPRGGRCTARLTRLDTIWRDGTERWAQLSTASNIVTVEDTGHAIQFDQPTVVLGQLLKLLP